MAENERLEKLTKLIESLELELNSIKSELKSLTPKNSEFKIAKPDYKPEVILPNIPKENTSSKPSKKIDWEVLLGGNVLGKLGFSAIILAFGWFIKFAFDNQWINESGRIFIGLLIGFSTVAIGLFLARQKMRIVPESMIGTGVSILYLSLYGAYYFYDLINAEETFTAFALLSVGTSLLAGKTNLQILYIFSLIGSILAPILLSSGENSYRFLFTYLTLINLIFYYISLKNSWKVSPFIILLANCIIFSVWGNTKLTVSSPIPPLLYITVTFLIFGMREVYVMPRLRKFIEVSSNLLVLILVLTFSFFGYWVVNTFYPNLTSHFLLFHAFLLVGFLKIYEKYSLPVLEKTSQKFSLSGILFLSWISISFAAITLFAEGRWVSFSWILFAGSLSALGAHFKNKTYILFSLLPWLFALLKLYFIESEYSFHIYFIANSRFGLFVLATSFLLFTYLIQKKNSMHSSMVGFVFVALFTLILGSLVEVHYLVSDPYYRNLGYSYIIGFYMIALLIPGFKFSYKSFRLTGIILGAILISKFYLYDIWTMSIVVRIIAGFSLGIGLVVLSIIYQKYKDKINVNQILKLTVFPFLIFGLFFDANTISADSFKSSNFKYFSQVKGLTKEIVEDENNIYGKIRLTEEITRYHGTSDLRLIYNDELIPFFQRRVTQVGNKTGKTTPTVIYTNVLASGRVYVLKFEEPPAKTEYTELEIAGSERYETGVYVSLGDEPNDWTESTSASIYNYYDNQLGKVNRIKFRSGKYRYARLEFDTKLQFEFTGAIYSPTKEKSEYRVDIKLEDFIQRNESDRKATAYYFDNPLHRPISRIVLNFEENKYQRNLEIYQKNPSTKEFSILTETVIYKKPESKDGHNIELNDYEGRELKLVLVNNDDKPLTLKTIDAYSEIEELVFELPKSHNVDENKKFLLYYGNEYVRFPEFDIKSTYDENLKHVNFKLGEHQVNSEYAYSIVEPPLSSWIIRGAFLLGILIMIFPAYSILKRYRTELDFDQQESKEEKLES